MELQSEFYLHITIGHAAEKASLMAKIALNLGHDPKAYPVDLSEIANIGGMRRFNGLVGFDELFIADFLRCAVMHGIKPWKPYQVEELQRLAEHGRTWDPNRPTPLPTC